MGEYTVLTDWLQRIDHKAGVHPRTDVPRKFIEHVKGDEVDFQEEDAERVPELLAVGAIAKTADLKAADEAPAEEEPPAPPAKAPAAPASGAAKS
jgi:hypothetical protein